MKKHQIYDFSLALPATEDRSNVSALLRHLANTIDFELDKGDEVQDIVFQQEVDDDGNIVSTFTVYYTND